MKKFNLLGVTNSLFLLILLPFFLIISCGKGDNGGGQINPTPPNPVNPSIVTPSAPVPLDFNGTFSGNYAVNNAPVGSKLYKNEGEVPMSGVVNLSNIQSKTVVQFELRSSTGTVLTKDSLVLNVLSKDQTDIKNLGAVSLIKYEVAQDTLTAPFVDQGSINLCLADDKYAFNVYEGKCYFDRGTVKCDSGESKTGWSIFQFHANWLEWANTDPTTFFQFNIGETKLILTSLVRILDSSPQGFHWGRQKLTYQR